MQTKLTLRLDDALVRRAKRYSSRSGRSISRLVSDYFQLIDSAPDAESGELTPRVRSLLGALAERGGSEEDHKRHLEQKHR
jgi:hypothetical protein